MCSGWCNNWVTWQHARSNNENKAVMFSLVQCFITALGMVAVAAFDSGLGFLYNELAVQWETMKETPCILYHLSDYTVS